MRIVDRTTFLALPSNTLFSKYQPCYFGDLCIKMESLTNDFFYQQLHDAVETQGDFTDTCDKASLSGASINTDLSCEARDGMFDDDQLFAVWEPKDVQALINRIGQCLPTGVKCVVYEYWHEYDPHPASKPDKCEVDIGDGEWREEHHDPCDWGYITRRWPRPLA
jgi:hypothetical protein